MKVDIEEYKKQHPEYDIKIMGKKIILQCSICGETSYKNKSNFSINSGCTVCMNRKVKEGFNDIATVNPWMIQYFVDENYAKTHASNSSKKTILKCPTCGYIKPHKTSANALYHEGFYCPMCSDRITFPNKMAIAVLKRLPIKNWDREWNPKWANGRIYDNYFEYNDKKYVVEMDGEFHYEGWLHDKGASKLSEIKAIDDLKDKMAKDHNVEMIRIDSRIGEFEYIKDNILKSKLNEIFDLSQIDWQEVAKDTATNFIVEVCKYYNEHPTKSLIEIGDVFYISNWTVRKYLKRGTLCGFCNYIPYHKREEVKQMLKTIPRKYTHAHSYSCHRAERQKKSNYIIRVFDNDKNFIGEYDTAIQCAEELNKLFPLLDFRANKISERINGHGITHRHFYFQKIMKGDVDNIEHINSK